MTLYDVVPPALFFLSLGGITVIVARSALRMQQTAFSASIKTAATDVPAESGLLKPTQKSVQFFGNRAAAARAALATSAAATASALGRAGALLRKRVAAWREGWAERREVRQTERAQALEQREAERAEREEQREAERAQVLEQREAERAEQAAAKEAAREAKREEKERRRIERQLAKQERATALAEAKNAELKPELEPEPELAATPAQSAEALPKPTSGIRTTLVTLDEPVTQEPAETEVQAKPKATLPLLKRKPKAPQRTALEQATDALGKSEYQKAEDILVEHIVKHTKDTKAYLLLGQVALAREAWDEAIEIYEQVLAWDEAADGAWVGLGSATFAAGRYTKALPALQRAAEADPMNSEVLDKLMTIARNMDNPALQDAIKEKQAALPT